jgi:hypothetical protein
VTVYCIDTSSLIDAWERHYPIESFPGVWERLAGLVTADRLIAPEEVRHELEKKSDGAIRWARKQKGLFVPMDTAIQTEVGAILSQHPRIVDSKKGRHTADPFVIALAKLRAAAVVTQEDLTGKIEVPKIPDVCRALRIDCMKLLSVIRAEKWVFGA